MARSIDCSPIAISDKSHKASQSGRRVTLDAENSVDLLRAIKESSRRLYSDVIVAKADRMSGRAAPTWLASSLRATGRKRGRQTQLEKKKLGVARHTQECAAQRSSRRQGRRKKNCSLPSQREGAESARVPFLSQSLVPLPI